jgi:hypothetical protein
MEIMFVVQAALQENIYLLVFNLIDDLVFHIPSASKQKQNSTGKVKCMPA